MKKLLCFPLLCAPILFAAHQPPLIEILALRATIGFVLPEQQNIQENEHHLHRAKPTYPPINQRPTKKPLRELQAKRAPRNSFMGHQQGRRNNPQHSNKQPAQRTNAKK